MRLPKRIKINGIWYRIRVVPDDQLSSNELGQTIKEQQLIKLSNGLKGDVLTQVLIHELFHASNWELGETEVESISQDFCQILFDNQDVARRFVRRKK